ncbi:MAG: sulfatase-like hydrolase/transferase [Hymenobacter sp.]
MPQVLGDDLAKHFDETTRFDDYVGRVEAELKRQGVLDNTVILIISDNGIPFPRAKTGYIIVAHRLHLL